VLIKSDHLPLNSLNVKGGQLNATHWIVWEYVALNIRMPAFNSDIIISPKYKLPLGKPLSEASWMDYAIQKASKLASTPFSHCMNVCELILQTADREALQHWHKVQLAQRNNVARYCPYCLRPFRIERLDRSNCNEMLKLTLPHHSAKPIRSLWNSTNNSVVYS